MTKALIVLALLALPACREFPEPPEGPRAEETDAGPVAEDDGGTGSEDTGCQDRSAAEAGPVTVITRDTQFHPDCFAVSSTQEIQLENGDKVAHTFTIDAGIDVEVPPESRAQAGPLEGFLEAGTYDFYCRYHRDRMIGVVIVE